MSVSLVGDCFTHLFEYAECEASHQTMLRWGKSEAWCLIRKIVQIWLSFSYNLWNGRKSGWIALKHSSIWWWAWTTSSLSRSKYYDVVREWQSSGRFFWRIEYRASLRHITMFARFTTCLKNWKGMVKTNLSKLCQRPNSTQFLRNQKAEFRTHLNPLYFPAKHRVEVKKVLPALPPH